MDLAFVADLRNLVARATAAFDDFDYALPLQATEELFWRFCDDFVELVKVRSYDERDTPERRSAIAALHSGCASSSACSRRSCPTSPKRVVVALRADRRPRRIDSSRAVADRRRDGGRGEPAVPESFATAAEVLGRIRGAKTREKRNLRWPVTRLRVSGPSTHGGRSKRSCPTCCERARWRRARSSWSTARWPKASGWVSTLPWRQRRRDERPGRYPGGSRLGRARGRRARRRRRVATLTVSNPERLNILDSAILEAFESAVIELGDLEAVGVVVLKGGGDRAFIGGADIRELARLEPTSARAFISRVHRVCAGFAGCRCR